VHALAKRPDRGEGVERCEGVRAAMFAEKYPEIRPVPLRQNLFFHFFLLLVKNKRTIIRLQPT
jgi:hypothetical protein